MGRGVDWISDGVAGYLAIPDFLENVSVFSDADSSKLPSFLI